MLFHWRPRARDRGHEVRFASAPIASLTANTTTRAGILAVSDKDDTAAVPGHRIYVDELFASTFTVPADADGTILLSVFKYDASASSAVALVTGTAASVSTGDLELLTAGKAERLTFDAAVTDDHKTLDHGDFLYASVVNNSAAIDTQPSALCVTAKFKVLI